MRKKASKPTAASPTTPPTTPPAMAPVLLDLLEVDVGAGAGVDVAVPEALEDEEEMVLVEVGPFTATVESGPVVLFTSAMLNSPC